MEKELNQNNNNNAKKITLVVLGLIIAIIVGAGSMYYFIGANPEMFQKIITEVVEKKNVTVTDTGLADAVEKLSNAVVVVQNYQNGNLVWTGSGFVYKSENGTAYILTNHHVIESGDEIRVEFTNGSNEVVKVVGSDKYTDIAVLSLDESKIISVAQMGSSTNARVGDTVFTVGAPLDASAYSGTVTRGIISGKDRLVSVSLSNSKTSDWVMCVLQTDAAINSGNSGGPLANANGEVIGVNSLKLASNGVEGMGFAIPIETALEYAELIESGKEISRPYLGVSMLNLADAKIYDPSISSISIENGAYVTAVENNSPASKAGLQKGDIITKIDGKNVVSVAFLKYLLYQHNVGDKMEITVYRNNKEVNLTIELSVSSNSL